MMTNSEYAAIMLKFHTLEQGKKSVALKDEHKSIETEQNSQENVTIESPCQVCGCDPCDCFDMFGGSV